ncbi:MAG: biotin/lipoyl-binding protein [Candidatus Limiplasma sp.]|nr:biotin/lipoyl-binding protein [Candidatus Limiplasma sp.]
MPKTKASFGMIAVTLCTVVVMFVLPVTPKIPVSTAVVERGNLVIAQSLEGRVGYGDEQVCVAPLAGQVAQVNVRQGQAVRKGDVLLRLDTAWEEQALSGLEQAVYGQNQALESVQLAGEAMKAVWLQNQLSLQAQMREITLAIEAKTLRASADGVVGQVYVGAGDYAPALSPMLSVRGSQLELSARQRAQESMALQVGMRAVVYAQGEQRAVVTLSSFDAPALDTATGLYMQTLRFWVDEGREWLKERVGSTVALELLSQVQPDVALAPIAAVSASNFLWVIRDGRVTPVKVDPKQRDADFVQVPQELLGERVVLLPDEADLRAGSQVKESK